MCAHPYFQLFVLFSGSGLISSDECWYIDFIFHPTPLYPTCLTQSVSKSISHPLILYRTVTDNGLSHISRSVVLDILVDTLLTNLYLSAFVNCQLTWIFQSSITSSSQGQSRRRKNMTEFLGDANIPCPDTLAIHGGALPSAAPGCSLAGVAAGPDNWKNRATSRISVFFGAGAGKVNSPTLSLPS